MAERGKLTVPMKPIPVGAAEHIAKTTGASFCIDAHQLRQLTGAVGDVESTGSAPDAAFIVHPKNPNTIVIQMPMKMPNG